MQTIRSLYYTGEQKGDRPRRGKREAKGATEARIKFGPADERGGAHHEEHDHGEDSTAHAIGMERNLLRVHIYVLVCVPRAVRA